MKRLLISIVAACLLTLPVIGPAAQASAATKSYVALGDSVAAGAGLPLATDTTVEDRLCGRSSQAYPNVLASSLDATLSSYACSGAKADEGVYDEQKIGNSTIEPQLTAAFEDGTPDIITLTIGANDVRWSQFVRQCYYFDCGNRFDNSRSNIYLADLRGELNWIMYRINTLSGDNTPTVLVNGYYNPFSDTSCLDSQRMTDSETAWLDSRVDSLNSAISYTVSRYSFAHYVPVDFTDHTLCSAVPWVQGPEDLAAFHPTAAGQHAIAEANLEVYNKTATQTPQPEPYSLREKLIELFNQNRF